MNKPKALLAGVALITAVVAPPTSAGSYQDSAELHMVHFIHVAVENGVRDGCLASPATLKADAELILRRSGIEIHATDFAWLGPILALVADGWEVTSGGMRPGHCVASLYVELRSKVRVPEGRLARVIAYKGTQLLFVHQKHEMQAALREGVSAEVAILANEILKWRTQFAPPD